MGYFRNGTEGDRYLGRYCFRCLHWKNLDDGRGPGCPVWDMYMGHNNTKCNKNNSCLHTLIPRDKDGNNKQCRMFISGPEDYQERASDGYHKRTT